MAGPRQTSSLPAKKPKAKATKPATVPKPSLSSQFVVDSDDSEVTEIAAEKTPESKTATSRSKIGQPAESKPSTSQAKPSKKRKLPSPSPAEDDSGGSGSGSGRESDSNSEDETRPSKKRALAVHNESSTSKPKPATAHPSSAKPTLKPSTNIKPLNQNKERKAGTSNEESNSEGEDGSEDSSSESESASGKESTSGSSDRTSLQSAEKESPIQKSVPQQSVPIYKPPDGFEPTSITFHPASKLSEILAPSNLQGKQIWHITIPESVPISSFKEVSTQNIENGASILEYHGAEYGLVPESVVEQRNSPALLLPSTQTNNYQLSKTKVTKTLHLQQLVSFPSLVPGPPNHPNRSASPSDSYRKTPRQQPEGLRMRYRPFGASDDSDVESTPEPRPKAPEFRIPAPVKESSPSKKRKRHQDIDSSSNAVSAVKAKKRKHSPQATAGPIEDPINIDAVSPMRPNGAKSPTRNPHPELNGSRSKDNLPNGTEMREEGKEGVGGPWSTTTKRKKDKNNTEKRESPSKPATALLPLDVKQDAETMQPGEVVEGAISAPAIANAVEGTKSINVVSSSTTTTHKNEKAKRKEERRKTKEMERASKVASSLMSPSRKDMPQQDGQDQDQDQDQMMTEIENAQREAEIPIENQALGWKGLVDEVGSADVAMDPTQSHGDLTKEEKAKRKKERRKKKAMEKSNA